MTPGKKLSLLRAAKGLNKNQFTALVRETGQKISSAYVNNLERGNANSEHLGIHFLKTFATVLEVREFVMTSELRDAEIEKNAEEVLAEEVFETFLISPQIVALEDVDKLRQVVRGVGGPKWCKDWPPLYRFLRAFLAVG